MSTEEQKKAILEDYREDLEDLNEVIIRIFPHSEDGLNYDIYVDPTTDTEGWLDTSDDGGVCNMGSEDPMRPYGPKEWRSAFGMAVDQALDFIFPGWEKREREGNSISSFDRAVNRISDPECPESERRSLANAIYEMGFEDGHEEGKNEK